MCCCRKMASSSGFVVPLSLEEILEYDRGFVCKEKGNHSEALLIFAAHAQLLLNKIYECGGDDKLIKKLELQQVDVLRVLVPCFNQIELRTYICKSGHIWTKYCTYQSMKYNELLIHLQQCLDKTMDLLRETRKCKYFKI
jgi:hypothetical protein